jgi:uncharacterized protein YllA (UPF0747 family)
MQPQFFQDRVNEWRLGDLPGFPKFYVDYAECVQEALQFFRCRPDIESLVSYAKLPQFDASPSKDILSILQPRNFSTAYIENIRRLLDPETRIVWVTQSASLFGGSFSQILKCLTAIKLAEELSQRGVLAVPVCEVGPGVPVSSDRLTVNVLDNEGMLQKLTLRNSGGAAPMCDDDFLIPANIEDLFSILGPMTLTLPGSEMLGLLQKLYRAGASLSAASEQFWTRLFVNKGLVVVNFRSDLWRDLVLRKMERMKITPAQIADEMQRKSKELVQSGYEIQCDRYSGMVCHNPQMLPFLRHSVLPVAAFVAGPSEIELMGLLGPVYDRLEIMPPAVWPQASVTLAKRKNQKILEKCRITFSDLLRGKREASDRAGFLCAADQALDEFQSLAQKIEETARELKSLTKDDDALKESVESACDKILYQIHKLRDRLSSSSQERRNAFKRRLERLINELLPDGLRQEQGLSAAHFLFQYSPGLIDSLSRRLDVLSPRHQLITMD